MSGTITMCDNEWQQVAQWVTTSVTTRDNKWQWMTTSDNKSQLATINDNKWQQVTMSGHFG